jgi:hypothetical protein
MANSFIERTAHDFDTRLQRSHAEAMDRFDVQDVVHLVTALGRTVTGSFSNEVMVPRDRNASLQIACRVVLKCVTQIRYAVNICQSQGHDVSGVPEMDDVALSLRFALTELQNQLDGPITIGPITTGPTTNTAPDSWYAENQSKLCGPFC